MEYLESEMNEGIPTIWQLTKEKFWGYLLWVAIALVGGALWLLAVSALHSGDAPAILEALSVQVITGVCVSVIWTLLFTVPGHLSGCILRSVYSHETYKDVFEPLLVETHHEWLEARIEKRYGHAIWISLRGWLLIGENVVLHLPTSVVKVIAMFWKVGGS
jgi:hypothetical protein